MRCPKDRKICKTKTLDGIKTDVCSLCHGVWIEQHEVRDLVKKLNVPELTNIDELIDEWETAVHTGTLPKDFWKEDKLGCPHGHGNMEKHYFAGSHVGVDQCQNCKGFWLDGGEIKEIVGIVKSDPMDEAWAIFARENEKSLRTKLNHMSGDSRQKFDSENFAYMIDVRLGVAFSVVKLLLDYSKGTS